MQVDHNDTQIAARHRLLFLLLRMKKVVEIYKVEHKPESWSDVYDWKIGRKFEGVLNISQALTTILQYESRYNAAYNQVVKLVYNNITVSKMKAVDCGN